MKTDDPRRRFSREVKLAAVQRMSAGANVSKLSRELVYPAKGYTSGKSSSARAERRRCKKPGVCVAA